MVGTETRRDGNGEPRDFSFPTAISRPFPSLVSVPAVYHPAVRRLVPVPTVSRLTVCPLPGFFPFHRLPSCSHPIPIFAHNFSHPASPNNIGAVISIPFTTRFLVSSSDDHGCNYIMLHWIQQHQHIFYQVFFLKTFSSFPCPKKGCFPHSSWSLATSARDWEPARSRRFCFSGSTSQARTKFLD